MGVTATEDLRGLHAYPAHHRVRDGSTDLPEPHQAIAAARKNRRERALMRSQSEQVGTAVPRRPDANPKRR